jgi:hypothetical protein
MEKKFQLEQNDHIFSVNDEQFVGKLDAHAKITLKHHEIEINRAFQHNNQVYRRLTD